MDNTRFIHIITNPQEINDNDIDLLSSIVKSYPYFTIAQILLAIGYNLKEDKKLSRQLRLAAAMVADRNSLRHLLAESKEKTQTYDLPDEFSDKSQQTTDNGQQSLDSIVIPEIDLNKSQEELSKEMDLLEEKRKSLDELKYLIEQRIIELEKEYEKENDKIVFISNYSFNDYLNSFS